MIPKFTTLATISALTAGMILPTFPVYAQPVQSGVQVISEVNHDISPALTEIAARGLAESVPSSGTQVLPVRRQFEVAPAVSPSVIDSVAQQLIGPKVSATLGLGFDGVGNLDGVAPPDPNASVGSTQVVETVNLHYQVFSKTTGTSVLGPAPISGIWSGFVGTLCGTVTNYSDPVVLYDKAAARWLISIIAFNNTFTSNSECVAVSTSPDATGSYNRYEISFGADLPDYPKLGVWPDAYYASFNMFPGGGAFLGAQVCALDRTAMLAGSAMTAECFQRTTTDFSFLPSDDDGTVLPAAGEPDFFLELGSSTTLRLFKFHSDFIIPANATFTGPTTLAVAAYTQACAATGTCIPQAGTTHKLDSLGDRLMHRLAWRNLGGVEHLVATHSVKSGTPASAVRWYDITNPATVPIVAQQGSVTSGLAFWMGSIAMDKLGDTALGFSASSGSIHPRIVFTGRVPTDAVNTMESTKTITQGAGSQTTNRWGDYTSMSVDPADDCTFWYTNEYMKTTGTHWSTHLASFKFPGC